MARCNKKKTKTILVCGVSALLLSSCFGNLPGFSHSSSASILKESSPSSGASSSLSSSSSKVEEKPSLVVTTGDRLIYNEAESVYELHLFTGETLTVDASVAHPQEGYTVALAAQGASESFSISGLSVTGLTLEERYTSSSLTTKVQMKSPSGKTEEEYPIKLVLHNKGNLQFEVTSSNSEISYDKGLYSASLPRGSSTKLSGKALGLPDLTYQVHLEENDDFVLDEAGQIRVKEEAMLGMVEYVELQAYLGEQLVGKQVVCLTVSARNPQVKVSLEENDARIFLSTPEKAYQGKYQIKIPYSGVDYPLPKVHVEGYEGEYEIALVGDERFFASYQEEEQIYFRLTAGIEGSSVSFEIRLLDKDQHIITELLVSAKPTNVGDGFAGFQLGEEKKTYGNGDTISLQECLTHKITPVYNGRALPILNQDIVIGDPSIVSFGEYRMLRALASGETTLSFSTTQTDGNGVERTYEVSLKIKVINEAALLSLEVEGGKDALTIVDGHVYINGKIIVTTDKGYTITANGAAGLSNKIEDTDDDTVKKVTFTYTERGQSVSASYLVSVSASGVYPKMTLEKTFHDNVPSINLVGEGDIHCLVIPVWFTNSDDYINAEQKDGRGVNQKEQIREDLASVIFDGKGVENISIADFYKKESNGAFHLTGTVSEWYEYGKDSSQIRVKGANNVTSDLDNEYGLTDKAIAWYFATHTDESIADYDGDNDGKIDAVMMYYGSNGYGNGYGDYGENEYSRAFNQRWGRKDAAYTRMTWFSALDMYGINGKTDPTKQLATGDLSSLAPKGLSTATAIHEFGHNFGIPDYYDEFSKIIDEAEKSHRREPAGAFSMQDSNLGSHDPFSIMANGWASPYVFDSSAYEKGETLTVTLHDFQSSRDVLLLTPSYSVTNQVFDEYIAVELYTPTELNEYDAKHSLYFKADAVGLRVWHVDALLNDDGELKYSNHNGNEVEDVLHLIRKDVSADFDAYDSELNAMMFGQGDRFDMETYKNQFFVPNGKLHNGKDLGWTFHVDALGSDETGKAIATITLTRV